MPGLFGFVEIGNPVGRPEESNSSLEAMACAIKLEDAQKTGTLYVGWNWTGLCAYSADESRTTTGMECGTNSLFDLVWRNF